MRRKLLVVDDEIDVETMLRQRFRAEIQRGQYDFIFARDGFEALEIFRELKDAPLIITDIRMPRMDGLALLAEISRIDPIQRVVIVSAYGDMNNIRAAMNGGALDFLTKPIDFEDFQSTVQRALAHIAAQEESHKRHAELSGIKHELELARKIQETILPSRTPDIAGLNIFSFYKPMSTVGGDFFGFYEDRGRHLGILVADVVGHGIPAAMIAAMVRVAFNLQKDAASDAAAVLLGMERVLNESGMIDTNFVTACYVYVDLETMRLRTANAGHPPLLIHRNNGEVLELRPAGSILGMLEFGGVEAQEVELFPGDRIFAFTDGFFECGAGLNWFGQERLIQAFREDANLAPDGFMNALLQRLNDWNRQYGISGDFDDDLTAVVIDVQDPANG